MVRFNKKESEARKELLASMNQVNDAKENENGKKAPHKPPASLIVTIITLTHLNKLYTN